MTSIIENLPGNGNDEADARAEIDRLNDIWQKNLTPISLTVSRKYIAEISLALSNMKEAYATGEEYDFAASKKGRRERIQINKTALYYACKRRTLCVAQCGKRM